jgi:hemolysin III
MLPSSEKRPVLQSGGEESAGAKFVRRFGSDDLRPGELPESRGEQWANVVSHGLGFLAALAAAPLLLIPAIQEGGALRVVGASIFVLTALVLYFSSSLFHALPVGRAKEFFERMDHLAIYLFIAGTYTPFTLGVLRGAWGWSLFILIWLLAIVGVVHKLVHGLRYPRLSLGLYLGMGWLIVIAAGPLVHRMATPGLIWLAAGGIAYTTGVFFYVAKRMPYRHLTWHSFVLLGTCCHFAAIRHYAG